MTTLPAATDVLLRDGRVLRLCAPASELRDDLAAFLASLSPHSMALRFHAAVRARSGLTEPYLDPDWETRGALAGLVGEARGTRVVALGSYDRLRDERAAEVGLAVADDLQGLGIGTHLLEQLAVRAREHGIERFVLDVLSSNAAMLAVVRDGGFPHESRRQGSAVEFTLDIARLPDAGRRPEARAHVAAAASLRPFLAPRSVAVYGASARPGSIGGVLVANLRAGGFPGQLVPVNRSGASIDGVAARATLAGIEPPIELAVICVPAASVLAAAEDALVAGVRALCVISAGFAEVGAAGAARQRALVELAHLHGARIVGPNCLGIASTAHRLNATFAARAALPGRVGFASQSGALGLAVLEEARLRGLGLSAFVSLGNKADVSSSDLLEYWEDDEPTAAIALYLESFGNPARFSRIARRVARSKPIVALKGGSSPAGARAAASHTAALAGSDAAVDALFRQTGVTRARTLADLVDSARILSTQPLPRGRRVAVVTNGGGLGIVFADACAAEGLELPALSDATRAALQDVVAAEASLGNPIDLLGSAEARTFAAVLPSLLADPELDAICVLFARPAFTRAGDVARALDQAVRDSAADKPVVAVLLSSEEWSAPGAPERITTFASPEAAARALGVAARRAAWLDRPAGRPWVARGTDPGAAGEIVARALADAGDAWLGPDDAGALLAAYGIPLARGIVADTPAAAGAAAEELGGAVVVKSARAGAHKSESGGVALGLAGAAEAEAAARRIGGQVLVQPMLDGTELIAGAVRDATFGPLVAFGVGGIAAELFGAVNFALAPLTDVDAEELIAHGPVARLVAGFRGAPPLDAGRLTDLVHRIGALMIDVPEIAELDLNPVLAGPASCIAVDQRIRVVRAPERH